MFNRPWTRTLPFAGLVLLLLAGTGHAKDRLTDLDSAASRFPDAHLLASAGELHPSDIEVDAETAARLNELLLHTDARAAFYSDVVDGLGCGWESAEDPS
jgi:hypothetical protein